jgi:methylmalonyl-CoA/ethylmalonyl-CoA epimerase
MALSVHHVGIAVEDLDASILVYADLFGGALEHRDLVEEQGVEAASLRVGTDVAAELARLRAHDVLLIDETPRRGLFGLQVAFVHPEATGGVLAEFVSDDRH